MKAIYGNCSCDLTIMHESTIVLHLDDERKACEAFLDVNTRWHCGSPNIDMWTTGECIWPAPYCHWHGNRRYWSIHGPGGHIVGVEV